MDGDGKGFRAVTDARDFYRLLQVDPDAPQQLVAEAYRYLVGRIRESALARKSLFDQLTALNEAYATLISPARRMAYDATLPRIGSVRRERDRTVESTRQRSWFLLPRLRRARQALRGEPDHYALLGVDPSAEAAIIDRAYSVQCLLCSAKVRELTEAHTVLTDSARRTAYDALLSTPEGGGEPPSASRSGQGPPPEVSGRGGGLCWSHRLADRAWQGIRALARLASGGIKGATAEHRQRQGLTQASEGETVRSRLNIATRARDDTPGGDGPSPPTTLQAARPTVEAGPQAGAVLDLQDEPIIVGELTRNGLCCGLATFGLITALLVLLDVQYFYLRAVFSFVFLAIIPGVLIMLMLRISNTSPWEYLVYAIGLSISCLMFTGLAVDWLLPWLRITDKPLSLVPLLVSFSILLSMFGIVAYARNRKVSLEIRLPRFSGLNTVFFTVPMVFPFLAVLGATTLNNGGTNYLTMVMLGAIAVYVSLVVLFRDKANEHVYPLALLLTCVSLLLMYSLRSWHIIGWDINKELSVFQATSTHHKWSMGFFPGDAYNACLSITVLPTILSEFSHVPDEYVFKVIFNIIFAVVPVAMYAIASRYLNRWHAFLAVFFFLLQPWFFAQMPAIMRQEIGILFYVLLLLILLDSDFDSRLKVGLLCLFSAGLVVSHYSTAYFWLGQMGLIAIAYLFSTFLRIENLKTKFLKPSIFIIPSILLLLWQFGVTQSYSTSFKAIAATRDSLLGAFSLATLENSFDTVVSGSPNVNTTRNVLAEYEEAGNRSAEKNYQLYPPSTYGDYIPFAVDDGKALSPRLPDPVSQSILIISRVCRGLSLYVLLYVGFIILLILQLRKATQPHADLVSLVLSGFGVVLFMWVMPNLQANYNFSRILMQALVLACILPIVSARLILQWLGRYQAITLAVILATSFLLVTGFTEQFTGGSALVTLDRPNGTFDKFYVYDAEVKSAEWLSENYDNRYPVFADKLAGMRLGSYGTIASDSDIFPNSISRDGYVYLSYSNVKREHGFATVDNNTIVFNYPSAFLENEKNLIYNNGESRIFK